MERRLKLHEELCDILGSRNCYFNPPETVKLKYPCVIYNRDNSMLEHANNFIYKNMKRYSITVIDRNPDSGIADNILETLPFCTFDRWFSTDGLNHWNLRLFY